jgi:two-component system chemotaxis response regulator CheY
MPDRHLIPRVLIIDDTYFQRDRLRLIFQSAGFDIAGEADNGVKGVDLYNKLMPDLVTMDINMPYMGGIDAVREIVGSHADARIIMVSAMGNPSTIKEAKMAGALDFAVKPVSSDSFLSKVRKILESSFPDFYSESN